MARGYQHPTKLAPPGLWLFASHVLGRPVRADEEPCPHVCGVALPAPPAVRAPRLGPRDCAACGERGRGA